MIDSFEAMGAGEPTTVLETGGEIWLDVAVGERGRPSEAECKSYEGRMVGMLRSAGCDGVLIYDDVCPDRQLASWHSRPGMSCDVHELMTFSVGNVDFYVTVPCTPPSTGNLANRSVPPMDELEASCSDDADVYDMISDGLTMTASYDIDAYYCGDREYIRSFDRLDELVSFIASDGFRDRVIYVFGITTLGEGLDGDSGDELPLGPELELGVGELANPYSQCVHDESDPDDPRSLTTRADDASALIERHGGERAWVLSYSDGYYEEGDLDGRDYGGRRVMTYDEAVLAWQNYPLEDELANALGEGGYGDEHYELHILLNYATDLDTHGSDDDRDWEWDSLIPVADRYVLYDPDED